MKAIILTLALAALSTPAYAALKVGDTAPDFTATASLGGKDFTFRLYRALEKGPAVVYFYPSAYTQGCDLEAHTFAESKDKFDAAGASIIGVSGDNLERLNRFASDPNFCAGKFPIASDESLKIAKSYDLATVASLANVKDVHGVVLGHGMTERVTFVIGRNHKIIAVMSSRNDKSQKINQAIQEQASKADDGPDDASQALSPDQHVDRALAIVRRLASHKGA
jgi:peroxiredoxin